MAKFLIANNKIVILNPTSGTKKFVLASGAGESYTITPTLSHVTGNSSNPTKIAKNGTATLIYESDEGYNLPASVSVTGATVQSWTVENI